MQECTADGERNEGESGRPNVMYKPFCNGQAAAAREGDWGKFCPGGQSVGGGDGSSGQDLKAGDPCQLQNRERTRLDCPEGT